MEPIIVKNMTGLFKKELVMYSLFDMQLQSPLKLAAVGYFLILAIFWSAPWLFILWVPDVYGAMWAFLPAVGGAIAMSSPIWGGKPFSHFIKCQIQYIFSPKMYYENYYGGKMPDMIIDGKIQVSRKKDYYKLARLIQEEYENKKRRKRK